MFLGKDGSVWKKHPPSRKTVRTRKENIIKRLPGCTSVTKPLKEIFDIFNYFINEEMVQLIVDSTNTFIESIRSNYARDRDALPTNSVEIRALFGLVYLAGITGSNKTNTADLWDRNGYGVEMLHLGMSLQRFRFLLRCLRFDDKNTREERRKTDKLAPIRSLFDMFVENCQNGYHLSEYVTIDEMLPGFRGRCSFRQYIPSKPNKYGIKLFALCDAKMFYTSKLEVYVGKQPEGPYEMSNKPEDIVLRTCQHLSGSNRNITMDNWFTSVPLARKLLTDYKLTSIGTLRKNKRELPDEFSKPAKRPEHTSMFGFTEDCTIVSYIPKKKKNVIMLSTMHHHDDIDESTGDHQKPVIITTYNSTKGGVDVVDKLIATYNCSRTTRRWPMVLLYLILNVTGINSQVIYFSNHPDTKYARRFFLKMLSEELIRPHLKVRALQTNLPRSLRARLLDFSDPPADVPVENVRPGRCAYCDWRKNRKTKYCCFKCSTYMCLEHIVAICQTCRDNVV